MYVRLRWFYRIRPAVMHEPFERAEAGHLTNNWAAHPPNPNQVSACIANECVSILELSQGTTILLSFNL